MTDTRPHAARGAGLAAPVEVASEAIAEKAVRCLFCNGFDTIEIAGLLHRSEPDVVALLQRRILSGEA